MTQASENLSPEERELQRLQSELDNALLVYSPQNPRIRVLQARVAALETQVAQNQTSQSDDDAGLTLYEIQLSDIDSQIESIEEQKTSIEQDLEELQGSIEATPRNSIKLDELERELSNLRSEYQAATQSLVAARTGERIESTAKGQRITVLEPATVPRAPTSPNRPLIAAASVGAGLGLGLAIVVLLELLNASIRRPVEITNKLGFMPLGTLPYIRTPRERRRRKAIIAAAFIIVLVAIPAGIWAVQAYYLPLDLLVERIVEKTGIDTLIDTLRGGPGQ